ncbi:hypothetical protein [Nonomuraea jiangxiensis]|uniref:Uncharacterized protein n=1 Tax=Nonomuraea jiangxiensis TaxID=633440 RepID=A0A1G9G5K0_9ACTN|nr:hypothetical protein [Nonomuraea jiangxiensis]SDK95881.1 hypothetical protein SAMN05421869_120181 [Nonomuraea jiangxiensis]
MHLDTDFGGHPDDACALAMVLGQPGVEVVLREQTLRTVVEGDVLRFEPHPGGRPTRVLAGLDATAFPETWLTAVETAHRTAA